MGLGLPKLLATAAIAWTKDWDARTSVDELLVSKAMRRSTTNWIDSAGIESGSTVLPSFCSCSTIRARAVLELDGFGKLEQIDGEIHLS